MYSWYKLWNKICNNAENIKRKIKIAGLVSVNWLGNMDVAFQNLRMFQSFGLAASFTLAAFISVTMKLYLLIGLLGLSTTFYVAVEYYMRRREGVNQRVDSGSIWIIGAFAPHWTMQRDRISISVALYTDTLTHRSP